MGKIFVTKPPMIRILRSFDGENTYGYEMGAEVELKEGNQGVENPSVRELLGVYELGAVFSSDLSWESFKESAYQMALQEAGIENDGGVSGIINMHHIGDADMKKAGFFAWLYNYGFPATKRNQAIYDVIEKRIIDVIIDKFYNVQISFKGLKFLELIFDQNTKKITNEINRGAERTKKPA